MAARRTTALAGTLAAVLLGASALLVPPAAAHGGGPGHGPGHGPGYAIDAESFARQVTTRGVWRHLEELQRIADRNDGNRAALTAGYEASARYVERTLQRAGYTTTRDPFTFGFEVVDAASLTLGTGEAYEVDQMLYAPSTAEGGVTAPGAVPTDTTGCTADSWAGVEVTGAIAVVSRGVCSFGEKAVAAEAAGAVGVVVYNNVEEMLFGTLGAEGLVQVPVAGMGMADGQAVVAAIAAGGATLTLDTRFHTEEQESFNVIAETRTGRDDNVVMLGAHLDGVEEGPGINDNGTGSAVLLEVAVQLAKQKKHNNTVRFAWWGAEELGLIGSTAYVDELATQEGELDRIATYLNFDMVGSPNYIIGVYDADQSTYEAPVVVPPGSAETEDVLTGYFDAVGQPWVDTEFSGRSDYQAFIENGVPASGLFTGADDIKTEEEVALFGGTAGIRHDPNYHTVADDLSNVSREAIGIMAPAVAFATASLANDTSAINGVSGPGDQGHHHGPWKPGKGKGHWRGHEHGTLEKAS
ncbi:M20/M25/M40 family metallo-hydrolase [Cellulomonas wangsupingiae]|uniref:M20/M25/M40 family metallo-hydrolase n=1 Tax=Cellulomonas wangsupingiae TaxID=2968085 RepID=A0ABY5K5E6_9CELL|nr:M20/M25/M40 family metallo-hydrolase [Cellulomonas wangsupingiae]MCC2334045.1 M20/M25/M40 family metallo-hydrolase [Cellulomonas wangsupingiae]UUI65293.1 M20/M25/M40 family metallo-hydrolase [Cellulomonas wangsupingiae]